jgi:hypothetical protein
VSPGDNPRELLGIAARLLEDEAAANSGFFVAATDTVEHLLVKEGVDGRPASWRNQNACKHTGAGTATAERSIWGQVLGTDFIEAGPDDMPANKESLVAATGHEDLLRAREGVDLRLFITRRVEAPKLR